MSKLNKNLQNIVIVIIVASICFGLYYIFNKNLNSTANKKMVEITDNNTSEQNCNHKKDMSATNSNNKKWVRCPDPDSLYSLAESDSMQDDSKYSLFSSREGMITMADNSGLWDNCISGVTMTQDTLGYCLKNGFTSSGLYEEMARYACLGNTTNAIVKSILELNIPNGLANNESLINKNAMLIFMNDISLIYQSGLILIQKTPNPVPLPTSNTGIPNDKVMAQLILDKWINPANNGPLLIQNYVAKNNCHGQVLPATTATSTPAIITSQLSQQQASIQQAAQQAEQQAAQQATSLVAQQAATQLAAQQATSQQVSQQFATQAAQQAATQQATIQHAASQQAAQLAAAQQATVTASQPATVTASQPATVTASQPATVIAS